MSPKARDFAHVGNKKPFFARKYSLFVPGGPVFKDVDPFYCISPHFQEYAAPKGVHERGVAKFSTFFPLFSWNFQGGIPEKGLF